MKSRKNPIFFQTVVPFDGIRYVELGRVDAHEGVQRRHGADADEDGEVADGVAHHAGEVGRVADALERDAQQVRERRQQHRNDEHVRMPLGRVAVPARHRPVPHLQKGEMQ